MTRANFLQSIAGAATAALGTGQPVKAKEFDPRGRHYVLSVPDHISEDVHQHIRKVMEGRFPGCKITILDGGVTLHEVRPVGTADIEAAVERAIRKTLTIEPDITQLQEAIRQRDEAFNLLSTPSHPNWEEHLRAKGIQFP